MKIVKLFAECGFESICSLAAVYLHLVEGARIGRSYNSNRLYLISNYINVKLFVFIACRIWGS